MRHPIEGPIQGPILITGSAGLIGTGLRAALSAAGVAVRGLDLRAPMGPERGDVRDPEAVAAALAGCAGVVHLAAVSRVIWGEREPDLCRETNIGGVRNVVAAAREASARPWLIFASSREVYGQPGALPAAEDTPLAPVNIYGHTKVAGETMTLGARDDGLTTAVVRLSNVYGATDDHADRVVPAFARGAVLGRTLRVDGAGHTFDFTHLDDTVRGLLALIGAVQAGAILPPLHLLTGRPTTLGELAALAIELADLAGGRPTGAVVAAGPPRRFDVSHFHGDPRRTQSLLDWRARISVRRGMGRLIQDFRTLLLRQPPRG